jgi:hypothetical protein
MILTFRIPFRILNVNKSKLLSININFGNPAAVKITIIACTLSATPAGSMEKDSRVRGNG